MTKIAAARDLPISYPQQAGKLVFVEYLLSLRASAHTGVAIPPVERNQVTISAKNRKVLLLCGAIVDTFSL